MPAGVAAAAGHAMKGCTTAMQFSVTRCARGRRRDAAPPSPQEEEPPLLLADSPPPPSSAAAWRHWLYARLHTRRAHITSLTIIVLDVLVNVAGLMLSLFTCRTPHEHLAKSARAAEEALRWTSVSLLSLMTLELLARAAAVGPLRFFRVPLHTADAAILAGLLAVEAALSDAAAEEAASLLVIARLGRVLRLLDAMRGVAESQRHATETRVVHLEARVKSLEAALHAAERGAAGAEPPPLPPGKAQREDEQRSDEAVSS
jgi:hypothetical protein